MIARKLLGAVLAVAGAVAACGPSEQCGGTGVSCDDGRTVESCCTDSECRYVVSDGTVFPCSGMDCSAAADQAIDYCTGAGRGSEEGSSGATCTGIISRCGASSQCGQWAQGAIDSNATDQCAEIDRQCASCF